MKKWILILLSCLSTAASALPIGSPTEASFGCVTTPCCSFSLPDWCLFTLRTGFSGYYVYDKHLKVENAVNPATIHKTQLFTNAGFIAANFFDRIDLFATLGTTRLNWEWYRTSFRTTIQSNRAFYYQPNTHFSYSLGLKGTVWECGSFGVGSEFQYFQTRPKLNRFYSVNSAPTYTNLRINYREWQFDLGASYKLYPCAGLIAIPFAGVRVGHTWVGLDSTLTDINSTSYFLTDLTQDRKWGYAIGLTLLGDGCVWLTTEARFADEKALYFNGTLRF